jgi:signal transduction histidine kinase
MKQSKDSTTNGSIHTILDNIITQETKIVNNFTYTKFNNPKVEEEYQSSSEYVNIYFRHFLNIVLLLYYFGFLILAYYYKLSIGVYISIAFAVVQSISVIVYYIFKREVIKRVLRYFIAFVFSSFHICVLWYLAYVIGEPNSTNKLFFRLVFFSGFIYFAYLDNSLIVYLVLVSINVAIYVQIYYMDKLFANNESVSDLMIMFGFNIMTFFYKRNTDIIARTYLLSKIRMEKVYQYLEDLINSLNGYHVYFNRNEIISLNNNFKTFLSGDYNKSTAYKVHRDSVVNTDNTILIPGTNGKEFDWFTPANEFLSMLKVCENNTGSSSLNPNDPLIPIIERIQSNPVKRNDLFELLGHFNLDNRKFYELHFRKTNKFDNILELLIYDITEIRSAEINKTENKIKHECLAKIAHEFKTPINSIIGLTNQLKTSVEKGNYAGVYDQIQQIQSLSNFTLFLINDIIHYTSIRFLNKLSIKVEKVNIVETLEFCKNVMNALVNCNETKRRNVRTFLDMDDKLKDLCVLTDELRLKQILLNLISNSVKFTKNGYISINAKVLDNSYISIIIKDTGIGMKEEILTAIRAKQVTTSLDRETNKMGTGLGLTICNSLAERMNHKLVFRSVYGFGSTISLIIPYQQKRNTKNQSSQDLGRIHLSDHLANLCLPNEFEENRRRVNLHLDDSTVHNFDDSSCSSQDTIKVDFIPNFNSEHFLTNGYDDSSNVDSLIKRKESLLPKILIVDDNQHMRSTLKQLLKQISKDHGRAYNIIEGNDGIDILKHVIDDQSECNRIKCIITDESMDYLNGSFTVSLLRTMQNENKIKDVKVICMTSYEDEVTRGSILNAGVNYCVSKPCKKKDMEEILKLIKVI